MKILKIFFSFFLLFFLINKEAIASEDFYISSKTTYKINQNLNTNIIYEISIKNNTTEKYLPDFDLILKGITPKNISYIDSKGAKIIKEKYENNNIIIPIKFDNALVGKNNERNFAISFEENTLVKKSGDIFEMIIPEVDLSNFDNFQTEIIIPKSFGNLSYISPEPTKTLDDNENQIYIFDKDTISNKEIKAAFGEFQVYKLTLNYHLENPVRVESKMNIAIPMQTNNQNIFIESIEPKPVNLKKDIDGNWIAEYSLLSREKLNVKINLYAQIFGSNVNKEKLTEEQIKLYTKADDYWEKDNDKIMALANELKTIDNIYQYVVNTLQYDLESVKPETKRKGAFLALQTPSTSLCTEFTDLFIALARAINIPAREINGYAFQEFPQNQPLSLVKDTLHAWPQYWDFNKEAWINVDPTWEKTTNGIDYFNQFDLRHISFVIHGSSSTLPNAVGSYKISNEPQKDIFVNISNLPDSRNPKAKISFKNNLIIIENIGKSILPKQNLYVYFDNKKQKEIEINELLPFENIQFTENLPTNVFNKNRPTTIRIEYAGENLEINLDQKISNLVKAIFILLIIFATIIFLILIK